MKAFSTFQTKEVIGSLVSYLVFLVISLVALSMLQGRHLWQSMDVILFSFGNFRFGLFNLVHILVGFPLFLYASVHGRRARQQKDTAEDPTLRRATFLLDSGYYGEARHPMYGMAVLSNTALGFSLCSPWGLVLAVASLAIFAFNAWFEERMVLLPQFGEVYRAYARRVRALFFSTSSLVYFAALIGLMVIGLFL